MVLEVTGLCKNFGAFHALNRISFSADAGEIISILGPSGSGKTTLLKIIAGIETSSEGVVEFPNRDAGENPVIIVFQDYVLFPHLTVFENIAFGLRARKKRYEKREIEKRVTYMLDYFELSDRAQSYPAHISGGQKQRVAIARAMVLNPYILLLDEPFANLDQNLKMETANFIRNTQKRFGITTIAVTHDQDEAFAMSDRIGVLLEGSLRQLADPRTLYKQPATLEVARFLGPVNEITPAVRGLLTSDSIALPDSGGAMYTRAESLRLVSCCEESAGTDPEIFGTITEVRFSSHGVIYTVTAAGSRCRIHSISDDFQVGDRVRLKLISYIEFE